MSGGFRNEDFRKDRQIAEILTTCLEESSLDLDCLQTILTRKDKSKDKFSRGKISAAGKASGEGETNTGNGIDTGNGGLKLSPMDKEQQQDLLISENQQSINKLSTHLFGVGGRDGVLERLETGIRQIIANQEESKAEHRMDIENLHSKALENRSDINGMGARISRVEDRVTVIEDKHVRDSSWWRSVGTKLLIVVIGAGVIGAMTWTLQVVVAALRMAGV